MAQNHKIGHAGNWNHRGSDVEQMSIQKVNPKY